MRSSCSATKRSPYLPQLEKTLHSSKGPEQPINYTWFTQRHIASKYSENLLFIMANNWKRSKPTLTGEEINNDTYLHWSIVKWSRSVVSDSSRPHRLWPTRLLHPWDFPGKSTGVGCYFLLQRIFPTQGSNPGLPHCWQTLYHLSHQGSPGVYYSAIKEWLNTCNNTALH